jgi:sortase A
MSPGWTYLTSVLSGLTLLALGFVGLLTVGSQLENGRDQQVLYNDYRQDLADGKAPVGPVDWEGTLLPLGAPVAVMSIAGSDASLVVVEGTASAQTMKGPGHRRDTVLPGQAGTSIVMGRQSAYGGAFGQIGNLQIGSQIVVTTGQGIATFTVDRIRRAGDTLPNPLESGKSRLTLVSAEGTPYLPTSVVRVDASLVSTSFDGTNPVPDPFPSVRRLVTSAGLSDSERPMGIDTSQVFALVLWSQAFLIGIVAFTWARTRWGGWQAWTVGLPVLLWLGWAVTNQLALLLPNLT